jgi:predicted O-methyltransferase YrrM
VLNKLHSAWHFLKHFLTASRGGHGVHSPFAYSLCESVFYNPHPFYFFEKAEAIRKKLVKDVTLIDCGSFGAGSSAFNSSVRPVNRIARKGITRQRQSEMLFRLVSFVKPGNVIELGTSIGLNTLYLAEAAKPGPVYSIEGSGNLQAFAKKLAKDEEVLNIRFIQGNFANELPQLLSEIKQADFVYVDGDHSYSSTVRIFRELLDVRHDSLVVVLDDIYWSREMTRAWKEICRDPAVRLSIDCYYFGVVFFRPEQMEKVHYNLSV